MACNTTPCTRRVGRIKDPLCGITYSELKLITYNRLYDFEGILFYVLTDAFAEGLAITLAR
jgi:hypothetical protein